MRENFELRIREFSKLKQGWNYGKGEPFSEVHIELAVQLAKRYFKSHGFSVSGTPKEDGSIDLTFNKNDHFIDVKILPNSHKVSVLYCKGIGKNRIEESWGTVDISKLDNIFEEFKEVVTD